MDFQNSPGNQQQPDLLTVTEIAEYLHAPLGTVRGILGRRELPTVKIGRRVYVHRADLDAFIERHTRPAVGGRR